MSKLKVAVDALEAATKLEAEALAAYENLVASRKRLAARRDKVIRQMRAEGATLRAIAEVAKMTAPGVQRVIDRAPK